MFLGVLNIILNISIYPSYLELKIRFIQIVIIVSFVISNFGIMRFTSLHIYEVPFMRVSSFFISIMCIAVSICNVLPVRHFLFGRI